MAWKMDRNEYFQRKEQGEKDYGIARSHHISLRTLDRWKKAEGIVLGINGSKRRSKNPV
jgi:hypothetical protein